MYVYDTQRIDAWLQLYSSLLASQEGITSEWQQRQVIKSLSKIDNLVESFRLT